MFLLPLLRYALIFLTPIALLSTTSLYLYPVFHLCAFPAPNSSPRSSFLDTLRQHAPFSAVAAPSPPSAPFRLLALGDPQLEGESSIRNIHAPLFPHLYSLRANALSASHNPLQRLRLSLHDLIDFYLADIPSFLEILRKRVDFIGNDYYLGHIYRCLSWWTNPTHVVVLGDLVGSQWIEDPEFEDRAWRFWNRVFRGGRRVEDGVAREPSTDADDLEILGKDNGAWKTRIINVAGNHDIGYAGDLTAERVERFTRLFGKANYEVRFQLPMNNTYLPSANTSSDDSQLSISSTPELRLVLLNSMNLDTPALSTPLQVSTYDFLNGAITTSYPVTHPSLFTVLLTHIPLHKEAGICVDAPFFSFHDHDNDLGLHGVKEQNHLSPAASTGILEGLFGLSGDPHAPGAGFGRNGVILNGHDHEGCDTYHYINQSAPPERAWQAKLWHDALAHGVTDEPHVPGLRELTVRSMMGDFGGNAGLFSAWFDANDREWHFEFQNCALGTQHKWWFVHVLDLILVIGGLLYIILAGLERAGLLAGDESNAQKHRGNRKRSAIAGKKRPVNGASKSAASESAAATNGHLNILNPRDKRTRTAKPETPQVLSSPSPSARTSPS